MEGIAPRCQGIVIPVYGESESGELTPCSQEDLGRAISLALEAGANLINISGGELIRPGDVDHLLERIVKSCDQQDVVIIAATGNEGCECLHVPAFLETVLAVGAADATGQPMPFSNWDESLASHGVLAPGEEITGAVPGGGVEAQNGTSFACPIVTGVAALLVSLQKLNGETPSAKAVRDAIIASAIPCAPEEQAECERMLGGRLNVAGAAEALFAGAAVSPSAKGLRAGTRTHAIRAPPAGIAPAEWAHRIQFRETGKSEGTVMTSGHFQAQPQDGAGMNQGVAPQVLAAAPQIAAPSPSPGAWPQAGSPVPGVVPLAPTDTLAVASQPAAVRPQGCSCGGAQPAQGMGPSQQEMMNAQHDAGPAQQSATAHYGGMPAQAPYAMQPAATAYHGGAPMQAAYGTQSAYAPAQRALMHAGYPSGQQVAMPTVRGVTPSQNQVAGCPCPLPNDFISAENSQLIYAIGTLGYDFITDARRDYFVQQLADMSDHSHAAYVSLFTSVLGLQPDTTYFPEHHGAMAAYLNTGYYVPFPTRVGDYLPHPEDSGSLVWVLFQENQPQYALRPLHTFAQVVLEQFANFLLNQSRPEKVLGPDGKPKEPEETNDHRSDRISIAGRIIGDITLYNGQRVPVLDVSLRALTEWTIDLLIKDLAAKHHEVLDPNSPLYKGLTNFLERIYYEVRNLGQAPSDRAINFMATNIFEAGDVFADAVGNVDDQGNLSPLELDSIFAEKSPICRPKSDCWDVVMRFFDPKHRMDRALDEYRLTVDVNDISPVPIGTRRKWARFA